MRKRALVAPWVRLVREPALTPLDGKRIRSPEDVYSLIRDRLATEEVEVFLLLALDSQCKVRAISEVSRGILNSSLVHPREVFRVAIALGAASIIIVHNHPSGDSTPSAEDRTITRNILAAGELLDIPLHGHVIVGSHFSSLATMGLLT